MPGASASGAPAVRTTTVVLRLARDMYLSRDLPEGNIELGVHRLFVVQAPLLYVGHHSDNRRGGGACIIVHNHFPDGVFTREVFRGKIFVYDDNARRAFCVRGCKKTSAYERDSHHAQIIGLDFRTR